MEEFPEDMKLGDIFTGVLGRNSHLDRRAFYAEETRSVGLDSYVKTTMGWQDLPCLDFDELSPGKRYRFEIITQREDGELVCRALSHVSCEGLNYERLDSKKIRDIPDYEDSLGSKLIIVPSTSVSREKGRTPKLLFYDLVYEFCYDKGVRGHVFVNQDLEVNELRGRRVLVKVNRIKKREDKIEVFSELLLSS